MVKKSRRRKSSGKRKSTLKQAGRNIKIVTFDDAHLLKPLTKAKRSFVRFYKTGCPACDASTPDWQKLIMAMSVKPKCCVGSIDQQSQLMDLFKPVQNGKSKAFAVDAVPTYVFFQHDKSPEVFEGGRDVKSLMTALRERGMVS